MRHHADACRAIRPGCIAGERSPGKYAVARQRTRHASTPAGRADVPRQAAGAVIRSFAGQSSALCPAPCAFFFPGKGVLSLPFPRRAGKPILVLQHCRVPDTLPAGRARRICRCLVAGEGREYPASGKTALWEETRSLASRARQERKTGRRLWPLPVRAVLSFAAPLLSGLPCLLSLTASGLGTALEFFPVHHHAFVDALPDGAALVIGGHRKS